ncbi:MAG TPA: PAS domain S-box protein, partial [Thermodesulfobacteriota bacterium]|nr:PAS domain S-box protein [Thermodesulfobacteriota bacterium]
LLEEKYIRLDGRVVDVEVAAAPIPFQGEPMIQVIARDITERKRVEEALRQEKDRAQKYLDVAGVILVVLNPDQRATLINKKGCEVLACREEEILGVNWFDTFVPEDERETVKDVFKRLMRGEPAPADYFENRLITRNGEEKIIAWRNTVLKDASARILGTFSSGEDVTERKRAEDALRKSEEEAQRLAREHALIAEIGRIIGSTLNIDEVFERFTKSVAKLIPFDNIMINLHDAARNASVVRYAAGMDIPNRRAGEIVGLAGTASEECMRKRTSLLIQPDDIREVASRVPGLQPSFWAGIQSIIMVPLISESAIIGVLSLRSKKAKAYTGQDVRLAESISLQIAGAIANARLFDELQQAEETLRESEEKYRLLVQNANDAIFIAQDGVIVFANRKTEELLGLSSTELLTVPFAQFIHPEDRDMVLDRHRSRVQGKTPPDIYPFRGRDKSGSEFWVELNSVYLDWDGRAATLNFARDITEQKKLETQFLQAQKMEAVGRLAGGVAHDFNNLLTIINTYAQLAMMDLKDWDPLKGKLESIQKAGERAANLTRRLLAFSRREVSEQRVIDLNALLQDVEKMLYRLIGEDIELKTTVADQAAWVRVSPGQMEQAILNLVVNAKDAMPAGGKLTIGINRVELDGRQAHSRFDINPGRYVTISVRDTGVGMTPEVKDRIFEPFFTTKDKDKGTGLGLSTVYGVVKQSGGSIWVDSEPGRGTAFDI